MRAEVVRKLDELEAEDLQDGKEMRLKGLLGKIETAMMAERKGAKKPEPVAAPKKATKKKAPKKVAPESDAIIEQWAKDDAKEYGIVNVTPMLQQYMSIRKALPKDVILLYRLGDFYEMFGSDAVIAAPILNVALTKRNENPMAGIPVHAQDAYIKLLIKADKRVAIAEQTEQKKGKLIEREVTEVINPPEKVSNDTKPEKPLESRVEEYTGGMPKMEKGRVAKVLNKPARVGNLTLPVAEHIQRSVDAGAKITEQVTRNVLTPKRKAELQKESDSLFKEVAGKTRDDSNPNWVRYMEVRKALSDNAETVTVENFEMPNGDGMRLGVTEMKYAKWLMGNTAPTEKVSNDTKPAPTETAVPSKVGNTGPIPTAEESARWEAAEAYIRPKVEAMEGEALDAFGEVVGTKRQGISDAAYRAKILGNNHPDDLLDALNPAAETRPTPATPKGFDRKDIDFPAFDTLNDYQKKAYQEGTPITSGVAKGFIEADDNYFVDPAQLPVGAVLDDDFQSFAYPKEDGSVGYTFMDLDGVVKTSTAPAELAARIKFPTADTRRFNVVKVMPDGRLHLVSRADEPMTQDEAVTFRSKMTNPADFRLEEVTPTEDAKPPEQKTPEEWMAGRKDTLESQEEFKVGQKLLDAAQDWGFRGKMIGQKEAEKVLKKSPYFIPHFMTGLAGGAYLIKLKDGSGMYSVNPSPNRLQVGHAKNIYDAFTSQKPVSATAVDTYGITLPEGYTKQGELYVYAPNAPAPKPLPKSFPKSFNKLATAPTREGIEKQIAKFYGGESKTLVPIEGRAGYYAVGNTGTVVVEVARGWGFGTEAKGETPLAKSKEIATAISKAYPFKGINTGSEQSKFIAKVTAALKPLGIAKWKVDSVVESVKTQKARSSGGIIRYVNDRDIILQMEKEGFINLNPAVEPAPAAPTAPTAPAADTGTSWLDAMYAEGTVQAEADKQQAQTEQATNTRQTENLIVKVEQAASDFVAKAKEWQNRTYKTNRKQIELVGDGPSSQGSMSVGQINESKKRRAVEGYMREANAATQLANDLRSGAVTMSQVLAKVDEAKKIADREMEVQNRSIGVRKQKPMTLRQLQEGAVSNVLFNDPNFRFGPDTVASYILDSVAAETPTPPTPDNGTRYQAPTTNTTDAAYLSAVEAGDMATAQAMVGEAAKSAGVAKNRMVTTLAKYYYGKDESKPNHVVTVERNAEELIKSKASLYWESSGSDESFDEYLQFDNRLSFTTSGGDNYKIEIREVGNDDSVYYQIWQVTSTNGLDVRETQLAAVDLSEVGSRFASDPVIYNEKGAIPLSERFKTTSSQRFNPANEDIRYQGAKGVTIPLPEGKVLLKGLENPDFTTAVHEMAHAFEKTGYPGLTDSEVVTLKRWAGSPSKGREMLEPIPSEKFARGWERYIADGRAPLPNLQAMFDKMAKWMLDVYGKIKGSQINVKISPEVRAIFDKLASRMVAPAAIVSPAGVEMHTDDGSALPPAIAPNEAAPPDMSVEDEMAGRIIHAIQHPKPRVIESGDDWNPDDLYSLQERRALEEAETYDLNTDGWKQAARAFGDLWDTVTSQPQGTGEAMLDRLVATGDIDRVLTDREVATLTHEGLRRKVAVDKAAEELGTVIAQGASKELVAEKQSLLDDATARYQTIQNVAAKARTASGRALNAWKYALRNDFSYATLQSRTLAAYNSALIQDGQKPVADLPADQKEKIRKYSEEQRALQEEISRLRAAAETNAPEEYLKRIAEQDALIAAMIEERKQSANKSAVSDLTKRLLVDKVRKAAKEARARLGIADDGIRYQSAPNAANDPRWYDRVLVLAEPLIANPTMTAARFADIVLKQFGSAYEGVADLLRKDVEKHIRTTLADISGKNSPSPEEVVSGLSSEVELTRQDVYELARAYVFEGARDFEVMNKVFADLSQVYPELTKDEVTQLFTNYGKQQKLSPTEEATALRAARSLELVQKQIDDLEARGQMKRTGLAKDDPSPELRALRKRRDDLAKEIGYTPTDPATGLSSAQGAAKKRMSNEIQELERAIASGERRVRVRRGVEYTEDMNVLREKLLALRDTYENIFESERTPEERMRLMLTDLDRRIAKERDLINKGIIKYEKEALPPLDSPELTARRELLRNLRAEKFAAYDLLNPNERSLNQAMKEAQAAVERRQKLLDEGLRETPQKRERGEGVNPTEALRALWEAADAMDVLIREIRKNRPLTPAQQQAQLDRAYAQAVASREALRTKIETGDILSPPKTAKAVEERTRAIREENAAMRKQITQMQRDAGVGAFAPEVREAKRVASLEARIAELKRRRAEKDFSKKAVAKPVTNDKIAQLELDMELARYKFEEARARDAYKGLRWSTRKVEEAMAVWHARQMFNLSGDLGIFGRQLGKVGTLALQADLQTLWNRKKNKEPLSIKEGTVIGKTLGTGLKVFLNPKLGDQFYADLATSPRYAFLKANGLDLTKPHESSHELSSDGRVRVNPMLLFNNRVLGAVMIGRGLIGTAAAIKVAIHTSAPVWKAVTKGIADTLFGAGLAIGGIEFAKRVESAQLAMLNVARVAITESMLKMTDHLAPADKEAASQAIVETVMTFTGKISGKSGLSKWLKNNAYEVGLLFSFPQYMYTNLQAATGTPMIKAVRDLLQGKPGSKTTLAAVSLMSAHMYGGYAARIVAWAILFGVWDEDDEESTYGVVMNPDNPNFLKLKVGKTYIDFAAGWAAWLVKLNRFASDTKLNSEMLRDGYEVEEEKTSFDKMGVAGKFLKGQLQANIRTALEFFVEDEFREGGKLSKMDVWNKADLLLNEIVMNLTARDIRKMYDEHDPATATILSALLMTGRNINIRETTAEKEEREAEEQKRYTK